MTYKVITDEDGSSVAVGNGIESHKVAIVIDNNDFEYPGVEVVELTQSELKELIKILQEKVIEDQEV